MSVEREAERPPGADVPWHARPAGEAIAELETDADAGLSAMGAAERLERYGPNRIRSAEAVPWWRIVMGQVADPLIYILVAAAVVSFVFGEHVDAAVILFVIIINGVVGFVQEYRARSAIESLAKLTSPEAHVVRDGRRREIPTEEVVPGDVIELAAGGSVPADARLVRAADLRADESALTGESEPVQKQEDAVEDEHAVPGDRLSMVFAGTTITRGRARAVVVHTGHDSELGRIAEATHAIADVETPIQRKVHALGKAIGVAILVLALVVVGGGLLMGMPLVEVVRTAVALAVGAVPEALPVVLTVTLAVGVQRMAKRNAIIRSLPAVETLGSTTVIGSDKTGTLTTNQMTVRVLWTAGRRFDVLGSGYDADGTIEPADDRSDGDDGIHGPAGGSVAVDGNEEGGRIEAVRLTLLAGLLANEATGLPRNGGGDPTEMALLVSAMKAGLEPGETRRQHAQLDMIPFESDRQFMATLNETPDGRCVFLKGSPEAVIARCSSSLALDGSEAELDAAAVLEVAGALADEGYRVIGMALARQDNDRFADSDPGTALVFAGLQGMEDPVRPEAVAAVRAAREAGIRVIMLTGDHARTARAIGRQLGLGGEGRAEEGRTIERMSEAELDRLVAEVDVFARVSPEHKLRLVERLKAQGHIVAVTGDGVNDAPALQAAHLGIAMGRSGTDVAREASDMVLADDNFASITSAVEEGRVVFANIRKVTHFLLSTGVGLVLVILSSLFGPWPLPFAAVQVLWINLVTNGLQDVALAFEPGEPGLLRERPRDPAEGVISRTVLWLTIWRGLVMAVVTLAVFWWTLEQGVSMELARSVAMTQMVLLQFFHVFNSRSFHRSVFSVPLRGNPYVLGALVLALVAHVAVLHVGWLQAVFETEPLPLRWWGIVVLGGLSIIAAAELDKSLLRRTAPAGR